MSACLMIAAVAVHLAGTEFELSWQHSVEKTAWRESWTINDDRLELRGAAVKGSGAGMDPGDGASLLDGWWVWTPAPLAVENLVLAASGATESGWRLCDTDACHDIGGRSGKPISISVCQDQPGVMAGASQ